jgi:hypothetical protein
MAHAKIRGLEGVQRSTWTRGCRGRGRYTHDYICTCFRLGTHTHTHGTLLLLGATEARALRAERFLTSLHFSLSRLVLLLPVPSSSLSRPRPCRPARLLRFSRSTGPPWPAWPSRFVPSAAVLGDLLENELECEHQPTCLRQREDIHVYCKDSYACLLQGQLYMEDTHLYSRIYMFIARTAHPSPPSSEQGLLVFQATLAHQVATAHLESMVRPARLGLRAPV